MMGQAVSSLDIPITKGTSGVVVFTQRERSAIEQKVFPCIRCGRCVDSCPMSLNPSRMGALARKEECEVIAEQYHLYDCFECGSCAFACPSHIPLVQYFRMSKALLKERKDKEKKAAS